MLELKNICKTFNPGTINAKTALNNLSLTLADGDFVTVIGGNGAGKSTMLNAIAGVFPVDSGSILIDGQDVTKLPEHKRAALLGRVFQDPMMGTAPTMMIEENLALAARRGQRRGLKWGITPLERADYKELLRTLDLGLEDRLTSKVGLLSGGQRQALTLLMASLKQPKLLLLDEHTAALDPKTAALRPDRTGESAHDADDHAQHEGRHRARQPPHHDGRGPRGGGHLRRGKEKADRARPARALLQRQRLDRGERQAAAFLTAFRFFFVEKQGMTC